MPQMYVDLPLAPLFMVANVAEIAWYIAVGRRFWRAGASGAVAL